MNPSKAGSVTSFFGTIHHPTPPAGTHTPVYSTHMFTHTHSHTHALTHRASVPSQLAPQASEGWVYSHCDEEVSARPLVGQGQGLACPPSSLVHQRHRRPGSVPQQGPRSDVVWCSPLFSKLQVLSSEFPASLSVV